MQVLTYSAQEPDEDLEDGEIFDDDDEDVPPVKPNPPAPPKESIATIVQQLQQQGQMVTGGGGFKRRNSPMDQRRQKGSSPARKRPPKRFREQDKGSGMKKRRKSDDTRSEGIEEDEDRGRDGSPPGNNRDWERFRSDEDDDEMGPDGQGGRGMGPRRGRRDFGRPPRGVGRRMRGRRMPNARRDRGSLCKFFLQGNCQRGDDCPFSHMIHSRKWEMCKFYMNDCCVKKDKCNYMHEDFPCKFYHLGLKCYAGKRCKFSHRKVSSFVKQLLIKQNQVESDKHFLQHLQTTGDSRSPTPPDYSDYEAPNANSNYVTVTLKKRGSNRDDITVDDIELSSDHELEHQSHSNKNNRRENRHPRRHSRDTHRDRRGSDRSHNGPSSSQHHRNRDSNHHSYDDHHHSDEEVRTPMPSPSQNSSDKEAECEPEAPPPNASQTYRQKSTYKYKSPSPSPPQDACPATPPPLTIAEEVSPDVNPEIPFNLPKKQMELYMRIQQQQREAQNIEDGNETKNKEEEMDEDWYSSDEEGNGGPLASILDRLKSQNKSDENKEEPLPAVRAFPDIDVSAVSKLLSSVRETIEKKGSQVSASVPGQNKPEVLKTEDKKRRDPRLLRGGGDASPPSLHNVVGLSSSLPPPMEPPMMKLPPLDIDLRVPSKGLGGSHVTGDVDLRQLPFKPVPMHQAAREIDASTSANPPIPWILTKLPAPPKPDYSHVHIKNPLDPRLKKYLHGGGMSTMPPQLSQMQMQGCGGFVLPSFNQGVPMPNQQQQQLIQQSQPPPGMMGAPPQQPANARDPRQRVVANDPRRKPNPNNNNVPLNLGGHPLGPAQMQQPPPPFPPQQQFPNQQPPGFLPPGRMPSGPPPGNMGMYPMRGDSDLRNPNGAFHQSDVDLRFQPPAPHLHFP